MAVGVSNLNTPERCCGSEFWSCLNTPFGSLGQGETSAGQETSLQYPGLLKNVSNCSAKVIVFQSNDSASCFSGLKCSSEAERAARDCSIFSTLHSLVSRDGGWCLGVCSTTKEILLCTVFSLFATPAQRPIALFLAGWYSQPALKHTIISVSERLCAGLVLIWPHPCNHPTPSDPSPPSPPPNQPCFMPREHFRLAHPFRSLLGVMTFPQPSTVYTPTLHHILILFQSSTLVCPEEQNRVPSQPAFLKQVNIEFEQIRSDQILIQLRTCVLVLRSSWMKPSGRARVFVLRDVAVRDCRTEKAEQY